MLKATGYDDPTVSRQKRRGGAESAALKLAALEERIQREICELADAKAEAIALIDLLEDPRMIEILWEYYIRGAESWESAAENCGYSERQALRLHGDALGILRKRCH